MDLLLLFSVFLKKKKTCSNVLYESIATIIPRWMGSLYLTSFISITLYNLVFFCTPKLQRSPLMCFYTYFIQNAFLNTAIQYCNNLIQNTVKNKRLALYWLIEENSQKKSFVLLCIFLYKEDMIMRLMWFGFVSKFRIQWFVRVGKQLQYLSFVSSSSSSSVQTTCHFTMERGFKKNEDKIPVGFHLCKIFAHILSFELSRFLECPRPKCQKSPISRHYCVCRDRLHTIRNNFDRGWGGCWTSEFLHAPSIFQTPSQLPEKSSSSSWNFPQGIQERSRCASHHGKKNLRKNLSKGWGDCWGLMTGSLRLKAELQVASCSFDLSTLMGPSELQASFLL